MKHSESIVKLAAALAKAQSAFKGVAKDSTNPHFKAKYASLDAVMEAVRGPLASNGLSILQGATVPETNEGTLVGFTLETMLLHESGEWVSNGVYIPVEKASAQGIGSGISYGRRYGVSALLALTTDEDDDGNAATKAQPSRRAAPPKVDPPKEQAAPKAAEKWDGSLAGAASFPFPFKHKLQGVPLGEMDPQDLRTIRDALVKADPARYADIIARADFVLADHAQQQEG